MKNLIKNTKLGLGILFLAITIISATALSIYNKCTELTQQDKQAINVYLILLTVSVVVNTLFWLSEEIKNL